jgi:putative pyrroloquinoline-quinone binding quinoprotein
MTRLETSSFLLALLLTCSPIAAYSQDDSVLTYHAAPSRSGNFVVPGLTWERARSLHLDENFRAQVAGHVYAQPLYWQPAGSSAGMLLVATEDAAVYALDAATGHEIWRRSLGQAVNRSSLRCGNINPLGITGTPVIDEQTAAIYLDAALNEPSGPHHRLFALSLKDGKVLPGWPIDVSEATRNARQTFNARDQNQRGALAILDRTLYVPFGGHYGDCGDYHGWVLGVSIEDPRKVTTWTTRARGGGIWAPGGISTDGRSLFVATGNTFGASTWSDGEAVFGLPADLRRSSATSDFFAPKDWRALDQRDADLGGTGPIPLDIPSQNGAQALLAAFGKDGRAYILDRNNLGGIGGSLVAQSVSPAPIRTAPATFSADNEAFVAFQGPGLHCQQPQRGGGLTVLKIGSGSPPTMSTAWCASLRGAGSPIVTTTDGHSNPIVWILGAEGDNRLHGFRGDTGEPLFSGGGAKEAMTGLRHFQTLIATKTRLFVAADGRVYSFAF